MISYITSVLPLADVTVILIYTITVLFGITVFLFLFLVALRIIVRWREIREQRKIESLKPLVYEVLTSDESPDQVADIIINSVPRKLYPELEKVLLENAKTLKGHEMNILTVVFEKLGFADKDIKNLHKSGMIKKAQSAFHLGTMRSEKAVPALIETLGDKSRDVVFSCLNSLSKIGTPAAVEAVVGYLSVNHDVETLRVAEVILEKKQSFSPYLITWLQRSGEDHPDMPLIINLIGAMKDEAAVPVLIVYLSHPDPEVRAVTAEALGSIGDFTACDLLARSINDENPGVRANAAKALGRIQCDGAIGELAGRLSDPYLEVQMNCAVALTQLGEEGREALERHLSAEEEVERVVAAEALQKDTRDKD